MKTVLAWMAVFVATVAVDAQILVPEMPASTAEVRRQVVYAIDDQLAALRHHDANKAYTFAATSLQAGHPLSVFRSIVQENYPELWNNQRAEFGIVRDDGTNATVLVHVFAPGGGAA